MGYLTPTGATPSAGTPGRVAGPVVSSSSAPLGSATVAAGYKDLQITLHGVESFGTHFFQLYLNNDTTLSNYYVNQVVKYSTGTFTSLNQQAPYIGVFYAAHADGRGVITIPDYATTGRKMAFFQYSNSNTPVFYTGAVYYTQTDPIDEVQISLRNNWNAIGTAQNVTATYSIAYLL